MNKKDLNDINGVLVLDKDPGITSAKAIAQVKHKLLAKKIGHAGTLDPNATGILVCLLGKATKLASYFQGGTKVYQGTIKLGVTTDTDDLDGNILKTFEVPSISQNKLTEFANQFTGKILQIPPQISAIKINGKKAYEIVRDQKQIADIPTREVTIFECRFNKLSQPDLIEYYIKCSSGTYIRSIARDLGEKLQIGAAVATLRRTYTSPFSIEQAVNFSQIDLSSVIDIDLFNKEQKICHL